MQALDALIDAIQERLGGAGYLGLPQAALQRCPAAVMSRVRRHLPAMTCEVLTAAATTAQAPAVPALLGSDTVTGPAKAAQAALDRAIASGSLSAPPASAAAVSVSPSHSQQNSAGVASTIPQPFCFCACVEVRCHVVPAARPRACVAGPHQQRCGGTTSTFCDGLPAARIARSECKPRLVLPCRSHGGHRASPPPWPRAELQRKRSRELSSMDEDNAKMSTDDGAGSDRKARSGQAPTVITTGDGPVRAPAPVRGPARAAPVRSMRGGAPHRRRHSVGRACVTISASDLMATSMRDCNSRETLPPRELRADGADSAAGRPAAYVEDDFLQSLYLCAPRRLACSEVCQVFSEHNSWSSFGCLLRQ